MKSFGGRVQFLDPVPADEIPQVLAATDICVFPSLWENFPNVCLEAMSAARGIVASDAGGMVDQLDNGRAGLLVPPREPKMLADKLEEMATQPEKRIAMGITARARVLKMYGAEQIGPMLEDSYMRAIRNHTERRSEARS